MARPPHLSALIAAILDVKPDERNLFLPLGQSGPEHRARFNVYVRELRRAKKVADQWWQGLIDMETDRTGDPEHAAINVSTRRPAGPVVNPSVVLVIRSAWLDCQSVNDRAPLPLRVAPVAFVGLWLDESGYDDLVDFVARLPFWPVGLDATGRWV